MTTLTLLRHAKSDWGDPTAGDFDRPLNARGRAAAAAVGRYLAGEALAFDYVLASPARRVVETIAEVEAGYGRALAPAWDRRVYLASAAALLELVQTAPADARRLLLVGHNPGLHELALLLAAQGGPVRAEVADKYPTAALAELRFEAERWEDVEPGRAALTRFIRPRDLDAALGSEGSL